MRRTVRLLAIAILLQPSIASGDIQTATKRAKSGVFDASAEVRCAQEVGQAFGLCRATTARADGSSAVVVTFQNGFSRTLFFSNTQFLRGNATMSGVGTDTEWRIFEGIFHVRVDDQRFELPETLVFGE